MSVFTALTLITVAKQVAERHNPQNSGHSFYTYDSK